MRHRDFMRAAERAYWLALLRATDGNLAAAGRISGIQRQNVYARLAICGLRLPRDRKRIARMDSVAMAAFRKFLR